MVAWGSGEPETPTFLVNACFAKKSVEYNLHDLGFDIKMKRFKLGQLVGGWPG